MHLVYLVPDISIAPNNQTLPIPLLITDPDRQFNPFLYESVLGIVAGIGTGTTELTTSLNYYRSLSKDLTDA